MLVRCSPRLRSTLLWATCVVLANTASGEIVVRSDVFTQGELGHPGFRVPSFIEAANGDLVAFTSPRFIGNPDPGGLGNNSLAFKRSTDGGASWSALTYLGMESHIDYSGAVSVLDDASGDLFLFYNQWPDRCGEGCVTPGNAAADPNVTNSGNNTIWFRTSTDHGLTWSDETQIIKPASGLGDSDDWRTAALGPGVGIQLEYQDANPTRNGRLVIPGNRSIPGGSTVATARPFVMFSDDLGATWNFSDPTSGPAANETTVAELTSGEILIDSRQNSGGVRRRHVSSDGGQTFGPNLVGDIAISAVDATVVRYSAARDGDDRNRLLFAGPLGDLPNAGNGRRHVAVWTSYDEGQTFTNPVRIDPTYQDTVDNFAGYTIVRPLSDGTIGLYYETNSSRNIRYVNFDLEELEGATHPDAMSHYDGFGNQIDALRGGVGWTGHWTPSGDVTVETGGLEFPGFLTHDDQQQIRLTDGGEMTRQLGASPIDLSQDQDYYLSLFVKKPDTALPGTPDDFLSIRLDQAGGRQLAFGVDSSGEFFVGNASPSSNMHSAEMAAIGETYLLLAKISARDDSQPGAFDQVFLAAYDSVLDVPSDESQVDWLVAGTMEDNLSSVIDAVSIRTGASADWSIDALRIGESFDAVIVDTGVVLPVAGDITGDGVVDEQDVAVFVSNWRTSGWQGEAEQLAHGDLDHNGSVNFRDALILHNALELANGQFNFARLVVPAPSAAIMVFVAALVGCAHRNFIFKSERLS